MKNFRPFAETYIEVTMPLDEKTIAVFEDSERYAYILEDIYNAQSNTAYESVSCTMTVLFDFVTLEAYFSINTICETTEGYTDSESNVNIDLDPETAEYFKSEALKHLFRNMNAMKACQPVRVIVSA